MHKTNCVQIIEHISTWEVFSSYVLKFTCLNNEAIHERMTKYSLKAA